MSKIVVLAFILFGSSCLDVYAAQSKQQIHKKHHAHSKEITIPVRTEEWYLSKARESERFKAIALESETDNFLPSDMMLDHLNPHATIFNQPVDEANKNMNGFFKKNSALADPNKVIFMFLPPIPNNKLIDIQNRMDLHPTFILLWKE